MNPGKNWHAFGCWHDVGTTLARDHFYVSAVPHELARCHGVDRRLLVMRACVRVRVRAGGRVCVDEIKKYPVPPVPESQPTAGNQFTWHTAGTRLARDGATPCH